LAKGNDWGGGKDKSVLYLGGGLSQKGPFLRHKAAKFFESLAALEFHKFSLKAFLEGG
jgi:hypothetical protein